MGSQIPLEIVAIGLWVMLAIGLTYLTPNGITDPRFMEEEKENKNVSS